MSTHMVFADESGIDPQSPCYSIGAIVIPQKAHKDFLKAFDTLNKRHNITSEIKWNKIGNRYSTINLVLDWFHLMYRTELSFGTIVVNKQQYNLWSNHGSNREEAFYKTYTFFMQDLAKRITGELEVFIDERKDRYEKHNEVIEIVANHMLSAISSRASIESVKKADSKLVPGIQIADVLTGAINAGHRVYLDPSFRLGNGKRILIEKLAQMLGWDALWYDTMPNPNFNIWHFPVEYRAMPETKAVLFQEQVPYLDN